MPNGLIRLQHTEHSHFVTFSCLKRQPKLAGAEVCRAVLRSMEAMRHKYSSRIYGYVLMPEHVHLLCSEPERNRWPTRYIF